MLLSEEDRILIKNSYHFKGYGSNRLISEFPAKGWKKITYSSFLLAFCGKFTYQSLGTIAFKIIQIVNQNTILFPQHHLSCLH